MSQVPVQAWSPVKASEPIILRGRPSSSGSRPLSSLGGGRSEVGRRPAKAQGPHASFTSGHYRGRYPAGTEMPNPLGFCSCLFERKGQVLSA